MHYSQSVVICIFSAHTHASHQFVAVVDSLLDQCESYDIDWELNC